MKIFFYEVLFAIIAVAFVLGVPTLSRATPPIQETIISDELETYWYINPKDEKRYSLGKEADVYSNLSQNAAYISIGDFFSIQIADYNLGPVGNEKDTDGDGLSDYFEEKSFFGFLGISKEKKDSDEDGFDDKTEILAGYNPVSSQKERVSEQYGLVPYPYKGQVLFSIADALIWYAGSDGKLYFIGTQERLKNFLSSAAKKDTATLEQIPQGTAVKHCGIQNFSSGAFGASADSASLSVEPSENKPAYDCFAAAFASCTPAKLIQSLNIVFVMADAEYEILGQKDGKCQVKEKILYNSADETLKDKDMNCALGSDQMSLLVEEKLNFSIDEKKNAALSKVCEGNLLASYQIDAKKLDSEKNRPPEEKIKPIEPVDWNKYPAQIDKNKPDEIDFTADKTKVLLDEFVTLKWKTKNKKSCRAEGGWGGEKTLNGKETVQPWMDGTYYLACKNKKGDEINRVITVDVAQKDNLASKKNYPAVNFAAKKKSNTSIALSWKSKNAEKCLATGYWYGKKPSKGNEVVKPAHTASFYLTCRNTYGITREWVNAYMKNGKIKSIVPSKRQRNAMVQ